MSKELKDEGFEVNFLSVNGVTADKEEYQENLIKKCSFPLLQDKEDIDVWGLHEGAKDDFYIFDPQGLLIVHLPFGGEVDVSLSEEAGYMGLKQLIIDAVNSN